LVKKKKGGISVIGNTLFYFEMNHLFYCLQLFEGIHRNTTRVRVGPKIFLAFLLSEASDGIISSLLRICYRVIKAECE